MAIPLLTYFSFSSTCDICLKVARNVDLSVNTITVSAEKRNVSPAYCPHRIRYTSVSPVHEQESRCGPHCVYPPIPSIPCLLLYSLFFSFFYETFSFLLFRRYKIKEEPISIRPANVNVMVPIPPV